MILIQENETETLAQKNAAAMQRIASSVLDSLSDEEQARLQAIRERKAKAREADQ